jgi:hypothetical protein
MFFAKPSGYYSSSAKALSAKPRTNEESVHDYAVEWRPNFGNQRELFGTEQQCAGASHLKPEYIHCDATPPAFVHKDAKNALFLGEL